MNKYLQLWLSMDGEWHAAKDLGIAAATLSAMAKRNMVEATNTSPKLYRRIRSPHLIALYLLEKHSSESEYFDIFRRDRKLAMMCTQKNGTFLDCYGKPFDMWEAYKIRIGARYFSLVDGKELKYE